MSTLLVKKMNARATTPARATSGSAGFDLSSTDRVTIPAHSRAMVSTGIAIRLPEGTYGRIAPRSGLAYRHGIDVLAGVIDSDYIDMEIKVILYNSGDDDFDIAVGDRIAQLIIEKIEVPDVALISTGSGGKLMFDTTGGFSPSHQEAIRDQCSVGSRVGGFGSTGV